MSEFGDMVKFIPYSLKSISCSEIGKGAKHFEQ